MKPYLLDVNVLIALAWPPHVHNRQAQSWFSSHRTAGFCTCPLTQTAFVRISSNPRFTQQAMPVPAALALLDRITAMEEHTFWPDDLPLRSATGRPIVGHRQVTDAYLLALAEVHGGILATFDRAIASLAGAHAEIELLPAI